MTTADPEDSDRLPSTEERDVDRDDGSAADNQSPSRTDGLSTDEAGEVPDGDGPIDGDDRTIEDDRSVDEPTGTPTRRDVHPAIELREHVRSDRRDHWIAMGIAVVVGLAFTWLHWVGLVVGGGLVGLSATTRRRAPLAGLGFGVIVLAVFTAWLGGVAAVAALQMEPVTYVLVGASVGLPVFGSLVRWLE